MRKIFIYGLLVLATSLFGDGINWAKDYQAGIDQATKENKPVMFVISRHTCKYCVVLEENTFSDKGVIDRLNKEYVSIISYTDEGDYIPRGMYNGGTPMTWFLNFDGQPMFSPVVGARDPDAYMNALQVVKERFDEINNDGKTK